MKVLDTCVLLSDPEASGIVTAEVFAELDTFKSASSGLGASARRALRRLADHEEKNLVLSPVFDVRTAFPTSAADAALVLGSLRGYPIVTRDVGIAAVSWFLGGDCKLLEDPPFRWFFSSLAEIPVNAFGVVEGSLYWRGRRSATKVPSFRKGARLTSAQNAAAFAAQNYEETPIVVVTGPAGTGKTYILEQVAVDLVQANNFDEIVVVRPTVPVGKELGFLPGTLEEKLAPWQGPLTELLDPQYGAKARFESLSFVRGKTFNKAILFIDEAQNFSYHELKTLVSRAGKDSLVLINGDVRQSDRGGGGLLDFARDLAESGLVAQIEFTEVVRGGIAAAVAKFT